MKKKIDDFELKELSEKAMRKAAKIALEIKKKKILVKYKSKNQPVTEADLKINDFLKDYFQKKTPDFGWISEESSDDGSRLNSEYFWCLDPIDGTRSFIQNKPEYTISLALYKKFIPYIGLILNPETKEFFFAKKNFGAFCNDKKIFVNNKKKIEDCLFAISHSETNKLLKFNFIKNKNIRPLGSIAYKIALVAKGEIDVALSFTKKNDWDFAAASVIVEEAGGKVNNINGKKINYNSNRFEIDSIIASNISLTTKLKKKLVPNEFR